MFDWTIFISCLAAIITWDVVGWIVKNVKGS
jgi:hypothetical protein